MTMKNKNEKTTKKGRQNFEKKFKKFVVCLFFFFTQFFSLSLSLSLAHIKNNIVNKKKSI